MAEVELTRIAVCRACAGALDRRPVLPAMPLAYLRYRRSASLPAAARGCPELISPNIGRSPHTPGGRSKGGQGLSILSGLAPWASRRVGGSRSPGARPSFLHPRRGVAEPKHAASRGAGGSLISLSRQAASRTAQRATLVALGTIPMTQTALPMRTADARRSRRPGWRVGVGSRRCGSIELIPGTLLRACDGTIARRRCSRPSVTTVSCRQAKHASGNHAQLSVARATTAPRSRRPQGVARATTAPRTSEPASRAQPPEPPRLTLPPPPSPREVPILSSAEPRPRVWVGTDRIGRQGLGPSGPSQYAANAVPQ